jgi:hypothetical protein
MKHPVRSDFHTVVTEAGVSVTFKPTNSIYCFYRVTDTNDIARLGPVLFAGVQHAGRNTQDYPSDEVQDMAQRIASVSKSDTHLRVFVTQQPATLHDLFRSPAFDTRDRAAILRRGVSRQKSPRLFG